MTPRCAVHGDYPLVGCPQCRAEREAGRGGTYLEQLLIGAVRPTQLDRIEAAHWVRAAAELLLHYASAIGRLEPRYQMACADLDKAIEYIELARKALRGEHTRGGTSLLQDLGQVPQGRKPDTRPQAERNPERSA